MRRSVSMSRPCGRFAVGRCPSLDTDTELRRTQRPSKKIEKQEDRKTSKPWVTGGLDIEVATDKPWVTGGLDIEVATDKQGSRLVRWAAVEAVQRTRARTPMRARYEQVVTLRGATAKHVAKVAAARELLDCVFYALRDGRVRRLGHTGAA
jgi:hypothetical protein